MNEIAVIEAEAELKEAFSVSGEEPVMEAIDEVPQDLPVLRGRVLKTAEVTRLVTKRNINFVLESPHKVKRAKGPLVTLITENGAKVLRFAKTLFNKGRLHPAVARELGFEERKVAKTSILERVN